MEREEKGERKGMMERGRKEKGEEKEREKEEKNEWIWLYESQIYGLMVKKWTLEADCLGLCLNTVTEELCDYGEITNSLHEVKTIPNSCDNIQN